MPLIYGGGFGVRVDRSVGRLGEDCRGSGQGAHPGACIVGPTPACSTFIGALQFFDNTLHSSQVRTDAMLARVDASLAVKKGLLFYLS